MSRISFQGRNTNRKKITIDVSCAFITGKKPYYISFSYPYSQNCRRYLNIGWNFSMDFYSMMDVAKDHFFNNFFMEVFMLVVWLIWKERNDFIFNRGIRDIAHRRLGFFPTIPRMSSSKKAHFLSFLSLTVSFVVFFSSPHLVHICFFVVWFLYIIIVPQQGLLAVFR
jgi:hypothetical protein